MSIRFYMTPGSCSTAIHILLEEAGLVFEAYPVNLLKGDQDKPEYRVLNPKGTIPTLVVESGVALTDFQAIAWWIARTNPESRLLPPTPEGEARVLEVMNYVVGTLHGQGFARIFTTDVFTPEASLSDWVIEQGKGIVEKGLMLVEAFLLNREYVVDRFGIADAALFYVEFWAERIGMPLPASCHAHYHRLLARPSVRQVLMEEGYSGIYRDLEQTHAIA